MVNSSNTNIMTLDLDKSIEWYVKNFNFKVLVKNDGYFALLEISPGKLFYINKVDTEIKRYATVCTNGTKHGDIGFHASNIDEVLDRLKENNIEIEEVKQNEAGRTAIHLKDPDGNFIEIWCGVDGV